jgi:hypothetical protein
MLYAQIAKDQWPLGLEEVEYLQKELSNYATPASSIQVVIERGMFRDFDRDVNHERFRFVIIEWSTNPQNRSQRSGREVLGEYTDVEQVTGMLRLLLGMAKDKFAARQEAVKVFTSYMYRHRKI